MGSLVTVARNAVGALRPAANSWAVGPAIWAMAAAALVAGAGLLAGDLGVVGVAFLGAACATSFVATGFYRQRWWALVCQSAGAAIGISAGALLFPDSAAGLVLAAAMAGFVSGVVGGIGPSATAFGFMLTVGVAFGQFGGSALPWWQQVAWYLVGAAVVAAAVLTPWALRRRAPELRAIAQVYAAAADLCAAVGTDEAGRARARLAAAWSVVRPVTDRQRADLVAFAAATLYAQGRPVPEGAIAAIRHAGNEIRSGKSVSVGIVDTGDPGLKQLADALSAEPVQPGAPLPARRRVSALIRPAATSTAALNGLRIGLCLAVATGVTVALHERSHSFWLPLTTAVIVRPEYGSVFVRTVNRMFGTVVGALLTIGVLIVCPSGLPLVVTTALALGFAVLSAPKLYGLSVIGITSAALLSQSIDQPDLAAPAIRLLDTVIGAAVALIFGYLLWPGARRLSASVRLSSALDAARGYLAEAVTPAPERRDWQSVRDDAYRRAHQLRAIAEAAVLEPPPVSTGAAQIIPAAIELEDVVDVTTAVSSAVDAGGDPLPLIDDVRSRLDRLDQTVQLLSSRWQQAAERAAGGSDPAEQEP